MHEPTTIAPQAPGTGSQSGRQFGPGAGLPAGRMGGNLIAPGPLEFLHGWSFRQFRPCLPGLFAEQLDKGVARQCRKSRVGMDEAPVLIDRTESI